MCVRKGEERGRERKYREGQKGWKGGRGGEVKVGEGREVGGRDKENERVGNTERKKTEREGKERQKNRERERLCVWGRG